LGHVALGVRDLDAAVAFYTDLLGLQVSDRMGYPADSSLVEGAWLRCGPDHHCLALFGLRRPASVNPGLPVGLHHLAFEVGSFDDLLAAYRTIRARELQVEARIGGPGWQVRVYFEDPDGNRLELYWDIDRIGWDGRSRPYVPIQVIDLESFDLESYLALKAGRGM
jgi:catechol 2,3-dioxygenase-like lactoylglutathione lyase family enzyme